MAAAPPPAKKAAKQECIPEDVMMTILSHLPPKSLIRFKSVSKSWYNTITHPHMATLFDYNVAMMRDPNTFLFLIVGAHPDVDVAESNAIGTDPTIAAKINFYMKTQVCLKNYAPLRLRFKYRSEAWVVGACSGVICVASLSSGKVVLWNPATGEEKWVKVSYPGSSADEELIYMGLASVKDEKNNVVDFKLLLKQENLLTNSRKFLIYSLSSNSWRLIKHPDFLNNDCIQTMRGVYLNGVLHWVMNHETDRMVYSYILTFEAATENFGKIMLPVAMESGCIPNLLTLVDDKNLAVVVECESEELDVWVMCRYGDMKSWAKRDYTWASKSYTKSSVGYLDHMEGRLLQEFWYSRISYHIKCELIKLHPEISGKLLDLVRYRESFVSMKRIAGEGRDSDTDIH